MNSPNSPALSPHVYSYVVRRTHPLIRAGAIAARALAKLPAALRDLARMSFEESNKLPDALLVAAAADTADSSPESVMGNINAANATVVLATRYIARTVHPVIASGDMEASMAWAVSPEVRVACIAAMDMRIEELTTAPDEQPITLN